MLPQVQIADGLTLFQSRLPPPNSASCGRCAVQLADGPVPMYTPTVRGGKKMSVGMLCLGKHWNGLTYKYEDRRSDFDNLPVPAIPPRLADLATAAAADAGFEMRPDTVHHELLHRGREAGRAPGQGRAPGNDRRRHSDRVGLARRRGALRRRAACRARIRLNPMILRSGDVLVMGGPSRLRYHGVTRIQPGTAPEGTGPGRFNLTFRQY